MKKICLALSVALSTLSSANAQGQFSYASNPDFLHPNVGDVAIDASTTNCHSYSNVTFPSTDIFDIYVHSFDGENPISSAYNWGFAWTLMGASGTFDGYVTPATIPLPYAGAVMTRMDIGIIQQTTGVVQIAVAFWDPNVGHGIAFYDLDPTPPSSVTLAGYVQLSSATGTATSSKVNIDVNEKSNFVVTWEEGDKIWSVGGVVNSGTIPTLGTPFSLLLNYRARKSDVALCNSPMGLNAHYVYLNTDASPIRVEVAMLDFNSIMAATGGLTPAIEDAQQPGTGSEFPRIDCPDHSQNDDWSYVVMTELVPTPTHTIFTGVNYNGSMNWHYLNNATIPAPFPGQQAITGYKNDYPVVAFDREPNYIHYSWSIWYSWIMPIDWDRAYIGVMLENNSNLTDYKYWVMEQNYITNKADNRSVALSGQNDESSRFYSTMTYVFAGIPPTPSPAYINCKLVPWTTNGFKQGETQTTGIVTVENTVQAKVVPNPTSGSFAISLENAKQDAIFDMDMTDATGRQLFHSKGNLTTLNSILAFRSQQLMPGIYFINMKGDGLKDSQVLSVVKQ